MMHSADWIARAVRRNPYRGTLHNIGFTKNIYFGSKGFSHLNMNIGEDDLYMQKVMTHDNVSVILSPRATLREKNVGRYALVDGAVALLRFGIRVLSAAGEELHPVGTGVAGAFFHHGRLCAGGDAPFEYKIAALVLVLVRYLLVAIQVRRIARRGERRAWPAVISFTTCSVRCGRSCSGCCCCDETTAYGDS